MKFKHTAQPIYWRTLTALLVTFLFAACKKEIDQEQEQTKRNETQLINEGEGKPKKKVNPFSHENIKKAKKKLATQTSSNNTGYSTEDERLYTYIQFNPNNVSGQLLQQLEADSTIRILNFPFADGELYTDEFALDETIANDLADGNLYAVVQKNTPTEITLRTSSSINPVVLDELYLPDETDTTLQFQAFREAGYTEEMIERIRVCLFKRPQGFVRYLDTESGQLRGVGGMQVWGLVFGIPLHTYTDGNGYYRFPWRFNAGTVMGTHAKNGRVNIKPFNTQGAWVISLPIQFIVGSILTQGWVGSCAMRDEVNFQFIEHRQNRYWAQLMDGVNLHDQYSNNDNIENAPSFLTMYAHWADGYGGASAPLLGRLQYTPLLIERLINNLFDGNANLANNFPNIYNLLTGLLPDITMRVGNVERVRYSSRLMQTLFHELAHASYYRQVGQNHYLQLMTAEINNGLFSGC